MEPIFFAIKVAVLVAALFLCAGSALAYYDPGMQRWLNRDPLGDNNSLVSIVENIPRRNGRLLKYVEGLGGVEEVALLNANLYRYVANNPMSYTDPSGLWQWGWPPWGKPKPIPPTQPKPNPRRCGPACQTWIKDKPDDPFRETDCANCCQEQMEIDELIDPENGIKNAGRNRACQAACIASRGTRGPR